MNQARRDFVMNGNGLQQFEIPTGMKYVAVLNNTDNTVELYQKQVAASSIQETLVVALPYQLITVPIREGTQFTAIWTDGGVVAAKRVSFIFADENLNINVQTGSPSGSANVSIISESVGLARQAQLPAALTGGGNLKVEVQNSPTVSVTGNVEVVNDVGNPLPVSLTGTNDVDVLTLPTIGQLPAALSGGGFLKTVCADYQGAQANMWAGVSVSAGGTSSITNDCFYSTHFSVFGTTSAATDIIVQVSANGSTFYDSTHGTTGTNGNFAVSFVGAYRYIRLKSSAAATITATCLAK